MILVTFAVPFESSVFRGRPVARTVEVLHTGVGMEAAWTSVRQRLETRRPELVISSGFAGGLSEDLKAGEVIMGEIPSGWTERIAQAAGRWRRASIATSPEVLATSASKRTFREKVGRADAVDMESEAIQDACAEADVPLIILRAVSDEVSADLGLPVDLLADLSRTPLRAAPRLAWTLAANAGSRTSFFRFLAQCRLARARLADSLETLIPLCR